MSSVDLAVHAHPRLALHALELAWSDRAMPAASTIAELLRADADAPLRSTDEVRGAIRALLRHGGFKPSGRSKPASEYLARAASEGALAAISVVVDVGNAVSLHSGIPISVVDLDRAVAPLEVRVIEDKVGYVFNASGQELDLQGLLCLCDAEGPCANAVKDAQRTKVGPDTRRALMIFWGDRSIDDQGRRAAAWAAELLAGAGVETAPVVGRAVMGSGENA